MTNFGDFPSLSLSQYTFSEPIIIRQYGGHKLSVKVGYVREHPDKNQIVLEKVQPGKEPQLFYIRDAKDWNGICDAINDLWPELERTKESSQIKEAVRHAVEGQKLLELISQYPKLLSSLPKDIDILSLSEEHKSAFRQLLEANGAMAMSAIDSLSQQSPKDIADFVEILKTLRLSAINSLVTSITGKLAFIDKFETVVNDPTSYERRGDDSVHNLLKANPWILDQNFVILHEDTTINQILISSGAVPLSDGQGSIRPDFICLVEPEIQEGNKRIIIIEIKRPGIKISLEHVGQVLGYKTIIQKKSGIHVDKYQVYLIGSEIDPVLQHHPLTESDITTLTYTDFISKARKFFREYLQIVKSNPYSV